MFRFQAPRGMRIGVLAMAATLTLLSAPVAVFAQATGKDRKAHV